MEIKSRITTEEKLMGLEPNTKVYIWNSSRHDIDYWNVLARIPYNTIEVLALYQENSMRQISPLQLEGTIVLMDHDEAYAFMAHELRRLADSVIEIHLKGNNPFQS